MKKTLILDLDGTLYYQYKVQVVMGCRMLLYYLIHFWRFKEFNALMYYRKIREMNIDNIVESQYEIVSKKYNINIDKVKSIVDEWLFIKPLNVVRKFKDKKLDEIIKEFKNNKGNVIIYSDYPTKDKLDSLGTLYDKAYDSTFDNIRVLKPNPKGLEYIIYSNKLKKDEILFIGDRDSKDGECARKCGIDYVILPKFNRKLEYNKLRSVLNEKKSL